MGLASIFTPNATDLVTLFLVNENITSYKDMGNISRPFLTYYSYGNLSTGTNSDDIYAQGNTLRQMEDSLTNSRLTTLDMFVRWEIGMIIGYPSLVLELEKSYKRANGKWAEDINSFRTERLPQFSARYKHNLAKFQYFGISKNSQNIDTSMQFLQYLASPDASVKSLEIFPYLLPAQKELYTTIKSQPQALSSVFSRTKIDAFLPEDDRITIFEYGVKSVFDESLLKNWNMLQSRTDASLLWVTILQDIKCEIAPYINDSSTICE